MRINKLIFDNWCQHKDLEIDFHPGLTGIVGRNGRGKTNVLRGFKRVLLGSDAAAIGKKDQDLSWGAKNGSLEAHFTHNGQDGVLRRSIKTATASLSWEGQKLKLLPEINEKMKVIMGVGGKIMDNIVFVDQGAIESVIFSPPAERAKTLYALLGLDNAEKIREYLGERLNTLFVQPVDEEKKRLTERKVELEQEFVKLSRQIEVNSKKISLNADETASARKAIAYAEQHKKDAAEANLRATQIKELVAKRDDDLKQLVVAEESISSLQGVLTDAETVAEYQRVKAKQINAEKNKKQHEAFVKAQDSLTAVELSLGKCVPPDPCPITNDDVIELRRQIAEVDTRLKVLPNFSKLVGEANCPTCEQPLPQEKIKGLQQQRQELTTELVDLNGQLKEAVQFLSAYDMRLATYTRLFQSLTNEKLRYEATIVAGDAEQVDQEDLEVVVSFEDSQKVLKGWEAKRNEVLGDIKDSENKIQMYGELISKFEAQQKPSPQAKLEELAKKIEESTVAESDNLVARALLEARTTELTKTNTDLSKLEEKRAKQVEILRCRGMFERARALLHRDQLPNLAARKFISAINSGMNRHLELFRSDFCAEMREDLSFVCRFGNEEPTAVDRLSGGQKVALSLSLRLAFHDLFAAKLGLLILDEPSIFLDEERINALADLLERVKAQAIGRGLQMIVVTHEQNLQRVFDKVIEL